MSALAFFEKPLERIRRHRQAYREKAGASQITALLQRVIAVAERFSREYEAPHRCLLDVLKACAADSNALKRFADTWQELCRDILTSPLWIEMLFPEECKTDRALAAHVQQLRNCDGVPAHSPVLPARTEQWILLNCAVGKHKSLVNRLLLELANANPGAGRPFQFLSRFYFFKDMLYGYFVNDKWQSAHRAIFHQCYLQRLHWKQGYASDYPYQGLARLGISGAKPSEERLARYEIDAFLRPDDRVLDIGSNCGFFSLLVAEKVQSVVGIEYNPYLVQIANLSKDMLNIANATFQVGDFVTLALEERYDAVFSMANHCTIDGNLSIEFENYIAKLFSLLRPGGTLFFESHNIFGPGQGGPGDDGDMDRKFDIVERYFEVIKYKMTKTFVPAFDIDKLFVILRRRDEHDANAIRTFNLNSAKIRYAY